MYKVGETMTKERKSKQKAVLISDVHYNLATMEIADKAVRMAIDYANSLDVPLIVAGDLHDTKANLRGECVEAMMRTFERCNHVPLILRGNHDSWNERSTEHSLGFLSQYGVVISHPVEISALGLFLIPYHHDPDELRAYLKTLPKDVTLVVHQGITGANMGDYIQDKSALAPEDFADFRVISGHYHNRHDIKCGRPRKGSVGLFSYIGNPYTLSYGEANDPPKGFQVLMDDGTLEFVPTNLRKHAVINIDLETSDIDSASIQTPGADDLVWVKIKGSREQLASFNKKDLYGPLDRTDFRLDLIPTDTKTESPTNISNNTQEQVLDGLIDSLTGSSVDQKERLKELWRNQA